MPLPLLCEFWQKRSRKQVVWSMKGCHSVSDHWRLISLGMSNMSNCWFDDWWCVDSWRLSWSWSMWLLYSLYPLLASAYRRCCFFSGRFLLSPPVSSSGIPVVSISPNCRVLLWQDHRNGTSSAKSENFLRRFVEVEKLMRLTRGLANHQWTGWTIEVPRLLNQRWILIYLSISANM